MTRHQTIARPLTDMERALLNAGEYEPDYAARPVYRHPQMFDVQHGLCIVDGEFVRVMKESEI